MRAGEYISAMLSHFVVALVVSVQAAIDELSHNVHEQMQASMDAPSLQAEPIAAKRHALVEQPLTPARKTLASVLLAANPSLGSTSRSALAKSKPSQRPRVTMDYMPPTNEEGELQYYRHVPPVPETLRRGGVSVGTHYRTDNASVEVRPGIKEITGWDVDAGLTHPATFVGSYNILDLDEWSEVPMNQRNRQIIDAYDRYKNYYELDTKKAYYNNKRVPGRYQILGDPDNLPYQVDVKYDRWEFERILWEHLRAVEKNYTRFLQGQENFTKNAVAKSSLEAFNARIATDAGKQRWREWKNRKTRPEQIDLEIERIAPTKWKELETVMTRNLGAPVKFKFSKDFLMKSMLEKGPLEKGHVATR